MITIPERLELLWCGKHTDQNPQLEPRILIEDPSKSYGDKNAENMLIHGDNLLALKALEQEFAGKVKCIFIDPPYNTGSAFEHYADGVEHSIWLSLMRDRLLLLRNLLSKEGSIWITIDDNECHYLKVLCDEVFGRQHFVANCIWQKVYSERMDATGFSTSHDHILVYRKSERFSVNQLAKDQNERQFNFFDETAKRYYRRRSLRKEGSESRRQDRPSMWYAISAPDGTEVWPVKPDGTEGRWRWKKGSVETNKELLEFVEREGKWEIYVKQYLDAAATRPPATIWLQDDVGHNHEAKLEAKALIPDAPFGTPKPERLLLHVLTLATAEGDLVLDSFLGSGTTAAVAHKMGRRWIGIELGEHCETHCLPRLKKVCDGTDQGGISEGVGWKGGGGFKYYELAPSLLKQDPHGNWVISEEYKPDMLAAAMAKHEGFRYCPNSEIYWKHGQSSEKDFIFTTTSFIQVATIDRMHDEMQPDEHLLICCKKFSAACSGRYPNIEIKKIPKMLLGKCEFGREDYSLNIVNMPVDEGEPDFVPQGPEERTARRHPSRKKGRSNPAQPDLFGEGEIE